VGNNKPKIGIVTFWNAQDNYGELLQCYALQQVLIKLGAEPFLIKYIPFSNTQILKRFLFLLSTFQWHRILKAVAAQIKNKKIKITPRGFDKFRESHIKSSAQTFFLKDLKKNPPQADFYVCGSDQIWSGDYDEGYFLDFGGENIPKIAYAASFGKPRISNKYAVQISKQLNKFKIVSVREQSGVEICKKAGIDNVLCVPDPTLLLTEQDYKKIIPQDIKTHQREYLLVYLLGFDTANVNFDDIEFFVNQRDLEIIYVPSLGYTLGLTDKFPKYSPDVFEWLALMANAKYVLTNSFHGTLFSVIFKRKFGTYLLQNKDGRMNERI